MECVDCGSAEVAKGGSGRRSWHVDETYLKVRGRWCYLYRAIDRNGDLVDTMLSEHRDMLAAKAFFRSAKSATGIVPEKVTTDGHSSYPRAIRSTLGKRVTHRTSAYRNNGLKQHHRGIKGRIRCMRGFKSFTSAERFCRGYDELRNHLRPRIRHNQHVPTNQRRVLHLRRATAVLAILQPHSTTSAIQLVQLHPARELTEPAPGPGLSLPCRDHRVREPHGQTAAAAQAGALLAPVSCPETLLRNAMTAVGITLKGKLGSP